jgi:nucleotide-binding universal stress UspA family protein
MDIRKILVGFDGSAHSKKAFEAAVELALKFNASIVTVTVIRPPEFSPTIDEIDEVMDEAERKFAPLLQEIKEKGIKSGLDVQSVILKGHPAESIVKYAYDHKADLIVMGTRGLGGFKSLIIGSVAQKVVSYAKVPVLIIK